jgi:hypothetical protein
MGDLFRLAKIFLDVERSIREKKDLCYDIEGPLFTATVIIYIKGFKSVKAVEPKIKKTEISIQLMQKSVSISQ